MKNDKLVASHKIVLKTYSQLESQGCYSDVLIFVRKANRSALTVLKVKSLVHFKPI